MKYHHNFFSFKSLCSTLVIVATLTFSFDALSRERDGGKHSNRGPAMSGSIGSGNNRANINSNANKRYDQRKKQADKRYDNRQDHYDDRKDRYDDRYDDRKDRYEDRYDDRKEFYDKRYEDRKELVEDHQEWHEDRWRAAVGTALTLNAFNTMACRHTIIHVGSVTYYNCGNNWYTRGYRGGSVVYIVAPRPHGY